MHSDQPHYVHDCSACDYLGTDSARAGEPVVNAVDLYVHHNPSGETTLIRRYSSDGPDYAARTLFAAGCIDGIRDHDLWSVFVPHLTAAPGPRM